MNSVLRLPRQQLVQPDRPGTPVVALRALLAGPRRITVEEPCATKGLPDTRWGLAGHCPAGLLGLSRGDQCAPKECAETPEDNDAVVVPALAHTVALIAGFPCRLLTPRIDSAATTTWAPGPGQNPY